ncbi:MAG: glycosyltransferase family 2 protein [Propylenella sp.]
MKISVVTVCLNSADTIAYALQSFLDQDYPHKELVVIDGVSADETLSVVSRFASEAVTVISEPDSGIYDAMNKGLAAFAGDAVGFLNADDRFADPGCLSAIAAGLAGADIVYGDVDFVVDHRSRRLVRRWRSTDYCSGAFVRGWMPPHPTFYVRRAVVDAVGRFDTSFRIAADYDYMLRAFELHGFRSKRLDRMLVDMRHGGTSTGRLGAYLRSNIESHRSRRLRLGVAPWEVRALIAKPLRKLPQFLARSRAAVK